MPFQKTHLITLLLASSALGHPVGQFQENGLQVRNVPVSGEIYQNIQMKRDAPPSDAPKTEEAPKKEDAPKEAPKKEEASKEVKPEEAAKKEDTPKKEASKAEDATKKVEAPKKDEAAKKEDAPKEEGEAKEEEEGAPKSNAPWFNVAKIRESLAGYRKSFDEFTGKVRTAVDMTLGLADMAGIGQGPAADADAEPTTPPTDDKAPTPSTSDAQAPTPPKA
ncbi:hypothetical protein MJO28_011972 [Puccinia striiformis f. sp. tritici]|uniref:Uncharacterized protein n=3 Tax=Puccinia striiformis TaxID=27350 RepID=A0A0L0VD88_9BASI|nr:hypothetical protein Pst134EB_024000 [Puccinia striiformis f. sp. tritici]KAI7941945.1 hypothetical protein MJO28_011972 [Puccinia striiformis f. sp. tritici]KAI9631038.1 hypothetical protein KEM48_013294 [Puccinia striiformis f. sp. tritici PST-130]KNE97253.1 hypothetical protein PSTG_09515 [Puccinia striiformis f. sp. tritici PST-78]